MAPSDVKEGNEMDIDSNVDGDKKEEEKGEKPKTGGEPSASEENASKYPDMALAQQIHLLCMVSGPSPSLDKEGAAAKGVAPELSKQVMDQVAGEEVENPSLYKSVKATLGWDKLSEADLKAMEEKHEKTMEELEKKVEEAKESAGDMEVLAARLEVARFAAKSLTKEAALEAYEKVLALPKLSSGKKIDALMESSRVASFYGDTKKDGELIEKVRSVLVVVEKLLLKSCCCSTQTPSRTCVQLGFPYVTFDRPLNSRRTVVIGIAETASRFTRPYPSCSSVISRRRRNS